MDAAVAVDAQNAPTATWKTAQHAVSHSAHTPILFIEEENEEQDRRRQPASHTKFWTVPCKLFRVRHHETYRKLLPFLILLPPLLPVKVFL